MSKGEEEATNTVFITDNSEDDDEQILKVIMNLIGTVCIVSVSSKQSCVAVVFVSFREILTNLQTSVEPCD